MSNDTAFPNMMVVWTQNRIFRRNLPFDRFYEHILSRP